MKLSTLLIFLFFLIKIPFTQNRFGISFFRLQIHKFIWTYLVQWKIYNQITFKNFFSSNLKIFWYKFFEIFWYFLIQIYLNAKFKLAYGCFLAFISTWIRCAFAENCYIDVAFKFVNIILSFRWSITMWNKL